MNWLDLLLIAILIFSIIPSFKHGVMQEFVLIIFLLIGVFTATKYFGLGSELLKQLFPEAEWLNFVSFILIFASVFTILLVLTILFDKLSEALLAEWVDRAGGIFLGLIRSSILIFVIMVLLFKFSFGGSETLVKNSFFARSFQVGIKKIIGLLPEDFLQADFQTKKTEKESTNT
jgi:uncharacterized membrane protein required for colicin V production